MVGLASLSGANPSSALGPLVTKPRIGTSSRRSTLCLARSGHGQCLAFLSHTVFVEHYGRLVDAGRVPREWVVASEVLMEELRLPLLPSSFRGHLMH